jgi:hypothetical protein
MSRENARLTIPLSLCVGSVVSQIAHKRNSFQLRHHHPMLSRLRLDSKAKDVLAPFVHSGPYPLPFWNFRYPINTCTTCMRALSLGRFP